MKTCFGGFRIFQTMKLPTQNTFAPIVCWTNTLIKAILERDSEGINIQSYIDHIRHLVPLYFQLRISPCRLPGGRIFPEKLIFLKLFLQNILVWGNIFTSRTSPLIFTLPSRRPRRKDWCSYVWLICLLPILWDNEYRLPDNWWELLILFNEVLPLNAW